MAKAWTNFAERAASTMSQAKRDIGAGAGRDAVHRADHRLLQRADRRTRGCRWPPACAEVRRRRRPCADRGRRGPGRRRSHGPRRSAAPPAPPASSAARSSAAAEREVHLLVEGVELVRPVEGEVSTPSSERDLGRSRSGSFALLPPSSSVRVTTRPRKKMLHKPSGQSIIKAANGRKSEWTRFFTRASRACSTRRRRRSPSRGYWSAFPEIPSGKIYGETAKEDGAAAFKALLGKPFELGPAGRRARSATRSRPTGWRSASPIRRPTPETLIAAVRGGGAAWAAAAIEDRVGVCLEILARLNKQSFEMAQRRDAHHRPGLHDGVPGRRPARAGPRAGGRRLRLGRDDAACPPTARWEKPQGKGEPLVLDKRLRIVPRGVGARHRLRDLPDLERLSGPLRQPRHRQRGDRQAASGRDPAARDHREFGARRARRERASIRTSCCSRPTRRGADRAGPRRASGGRRSSTSPARTAFGPWLRENAGGAQVYTEEAGRQPGRHRLAPTTSKAMCAQPRLLAVALLGPDVHRAAEHLRAARRHRDRRGPQVVRRGRAGIAAAIDGCWAIPTGRPASGRHADPATLERSRRRAGLGRSCATAPRSPPGRGAHRTPLIVAVDAADEAPTREWFGPIAFVVAVADADDGIARAAAAGRAQGRDHRGAPRDRRGDDRQGGGRLRAGRCRPLGQPDRRGLSSTSRPPSATSTSPAPTRPATPA